MYTQGYKCRVPSKYYIHYSSNGLQNKIDNQYYTVTYAYNYISLYILMNEHNNICTHSNVVFIVQDLELLSLNSHSVN